MTSLRCILFAITAVVSVFVGFFALDPNSAGIRFSQLGYWSILVCFTWFIIQVWLSYRMAIFGWLQSRRNFGVIALAGLVTIFLYTREGGGFKIAFDEQVISNVSKSIHEDRLAVVRSSAVPGVQSEESVDKRPILFHFLLASIHDITGYRVSNAFYLNGILCFLFLLLLYVIAENLYDHRAGIFAIILAAGTPLLSQNSSGGGIDLLNVVGIASCFLLAARYGEQPESGGRLSSLILAACLFSHARYESAFFVLPVAATLLYYWIRVKSIQVTWAIVAAPLFFITFAWQHVYVASEDGFKQFHYESDGQLFDLSFIGPNVLHAARYLLSFNNSVPSAPILSIVGILSIVVLTVLSFTRREQMMTRITYLPVVQFFFAALIGDFVLKLGFTYGQLDNPIVSRLGIPFLTLNLICSALALAVTATMRPRLRWIAVFALSANLIIAFVRYADPKYSADGRLLALKTDWVLGHHESLPRGNYLYISLIGRELELHDIGNTSVKRAINDARWIKFHQELGTFSGIFAIQQGYVSIEDGEFTKKLIPCFDLGPWFELKTVMETPNTAMNFIRLSRVERVHYPLESEEAENTARDYYLNQPILLMHPISEKEFEVWEESLP